MKLICTALLALFSTFSFAQIDKGQWMLGGSLSGKYQKGSEFSYREMAFQAPVNVGYFVAKGLMWGIRGQFQISETKLSVKSYNYYSYYSYTSTQEVRVKSKQYSVGPFLRAYVLPNNQKFNLYIEPSVAYGLYQGASRIGLTGLSKENYMSYNLNIAPVVFLNPHTSLEFILSYNYSTFNDSKVIASGYLFGVGFQYFLGKGKSASKG
jgi:hypothetical protein